jgi:hypothetical protein
LVVSLCVVTEAFEVWGWRVPFLLSVTSLAAAVYLRSNMPESHEFIVNREELDEEYNRRVQHKTETPASKTIATATAAKGDVDVDIVSFAEEAGQASSPTKHYVPVVELFRSHWLAIILQVGYEAW